MTHHQLCDMMMMTPAELAYLLGGFVFFYAAETTWQHAYNNNNNKYYHHWESMQAKFTFGYFWISVSDVYVAFYC